MSEFMREIERNLSFLFSSGWAFHTSTAQTLRILYLLCNAIPCLQNGRLSYPGPAHFMPVIITYMRTQGLHGVAFAFHLLCDLVAHVIILQRLQDRDDEGSTAFLYYQLPPLSFRNDALDFFCTLMAARSLLEPS